MRHEWHVVRSLGVRYWIAWKLVQIAYLVKDTSFCQAVRIPGGGHLLVAANSWGDGVISSVGVRWMEIGPAADGVPQACYFEDFDEAEDWATRQDGAA